MTFSTPKLAASLIVTLVILGSFYSERAHSAVGQQITPAQLETIHARLKPTTEKKLITQIIPKQYAPDLAKALTAFFIAVDQGTNRGQITKAVMSADLILTKTIQHALIAEGETYNGSMANAVARRWFKNLAVGGAMGFVSFVTYHLIGDFHYHRDEQVVGAVVSAILMAGPLRGVLQTVDRVFPTTNKSADFVSTALTALTQETEKLLSPEMKSKLQTQTGSRYEQVLQLLGRHCGHALGSDRLPVAIAPAFPVVNDRPSTTDTKIVERPSQIAEDFDVPFRKASVDAETKKVERPATPAPPAVAPYEDPSTIKPLSGVIFDDEIIRENRERFSKNGKEIHDASNDTQSLSEDVKLGDAADSNDNSIDSAGSWDTGAQLRE